MNQELNFEIAQGSVFGSSIELQGVSKENVKILLDGVPVIGRLNGIIDLGQINLANVERIEIIEGPTSVFYGTDAMGGIINIISKKNQSRKLSGNLALYYESINAVEMSGKLGLKVRENTFQLSGGNYSFGGLSTQDNRRNLNWEKKNQSNVNFLFRRNFKKLIFSYNARFFREKLQSLGERNKPILQDKDYYTRRINNSLNLQGKISKELFLQMNLAYLDYQRYHNTFDVDSSSLNVRPAANDNGSDNRVKFKFGEFRSQIGRSNPLKSINYAFGIDLVYESTTGERILDSEQSIQTYAGFGSVNYKIGKRIELQPALRYTFNNVYGFLLSPAFNTKIRVGENSTFRFSYARGFRAPSLKELFLDFRISKGPFTFIIMGNENLEVETSHSFNLHFSHRIKLHERGSIRIEPSAFYNDITNLIALSELQDFKRHYINLNKFKSIGGKINVSYEHKGTFRMGAGVAIVGRYNRYSEVEKKEVYLYSPEFSSTIEYRIKKIGLDLFLQYKYTGKRPGFYVDVKTKELVETIREDYHNMDFSISKVFWKERLNVSAGVKNIFDVTDIETINQVGEAHARDMQLWGRSLFLKTLIKL